MHWIGIFATCLTIYRWHISSKMCTSAWLAHQVSMGPWACLAFYTVYHVHVLHLSSDIVPELSCLEYCRRLLTRFSIWHPGNSKYETFHHSALLLGNDILLVSHQSLQTWKQHPWLNLDINRDKWFNPCYGIKSASRSRAHYSMRHWKKIDRWWKSVPEQGEQEAWLLDPPYSAPLAPPKTRVRLCLNCIMT